MKRERSSIKRGSLTHEDKLEKFRKQSEFFKSMTEEERKAYHQKKIEELRECTRRAMKFVPNRNKLLDQIVAEMPTLD